MKAVLLSITCIFFIACHTKNNGEVTTQTDTDPTTVITDTNLNNRVIDKTSIHVLQTDSGTVLQCLDTDSVQEINSFLTKDIHVYVKLPVAKGDHIRGTISPTPADCNIRFNQVIEADGSMDGPFSREIDYTAKATGTLTIIIGRNLMAEGSDSCRFLLTITRN